MSNLIYVEGNVVSPKTDGPQIIAHVCNDLGIWCGDTARAIGRKWPETVRAYNKWYRNRLNNEFGLGAVQFVNVKRVHFNRIIRVANMVACRGPIRGKDIKRPIRYQSIAWCLAAVARKAARIGASVHMPRIAMDQTGARWETIETVIQCALSDREIPVYIYDPVPTFKRQMYGSGIRLQEFPTTPLGQSASDAR